MTVLSSAIVLLIALTNPLLALPRQQTFLTEKKPLTSLPVVLWHGLGDTYQGKGLADLADLIKETYPGTFVHSIFIDEDVGKDRNAGFLGHVPDQVSFGFLFC
jgi:palmitoyl-protein thioesterase